MSNSIIYLSENVLTCRRQTFERCFACINQQPFRKLKRGEKKLLLLIVCILFHEEKKREREKSDGFGWKKRILISV